MFSVILLACMVSAIVLFLVIYKLAIKRFSEIPRLVISIVTLLLFIGSSIVFGIVTGISVKMKNLVDLGGDYAEEWLYETFPENTIIQEGLDLSLIFEYRDECIKLANMLDSDEGMIDGLSSLLFDDSAFAGPLLFEYIVKPVYPGIKNYILEYIALEYPEIYNMLEYFYNNIFYTMLDHVDDIDEMQYMIEQYSGDYIITVSMVKEIIKAPIKAYITKETAKYQYSILIIIFVYSGILIIVCIIVTRRNNKKLEDKNENENKLLESPKTNELGTENLKAGG